MGNIGLLYRISIFGNKRFLFIGYLLNAWQLMIRFIVVSSFFLQDYISFIFSLVFLQGLFFWGCSFSSKNHYFVNLRVSEIHLFYNLQLFYWHFLEILWLFIFLVLYLY